MKRLLNELSFNVLKTLKPILLIRKHNVKDKINQPIYQQCNNSYAAAVILNISGKYTLSKYKKVILICLIKGDFISTNDKSYNVKNERFDDNDNNNPL